MIRNFITALQFLTIFSVKKDHEVNENDLARSMAYFPFVGFLIGIILVYADKLLLRFFPDTIANVFLIIVSLLMTRALHADGLADTVDGLMGGRDRESRLAIMRDSRIGTAGVLALFCVYLIKYICLNNLFNEYKTAALLTAPAFSRWSQMLMMFHAEYGREEGLGRSFVGHVRSGGLVLASVVSLGISAFVIVNDSRTAALAIGIPLSIAVFTLIWRWFVIRKIGGVTGDTVGAANEMNEALTLLLFVFLLSEPGHGS
jgi:adenosylcobinamide-GDP ribazoletransferase